MGGCRGVGEGEDDGGEEQQYSLRWSDFHASLASSFRRLRDDEDFVDVTLACDGRSFTAHKVVLSACSPYFRRLLKANPCQHPIVILRDVKQRDLEALLRFMYNGEVQIGQDQLSGFLATAQMLEVRGLAEVPSNSKEHHSYSGHHHTPPHSRGPAPTRANATSTPNSVPWGETGSGSGDRRDDNHVSQHHGRVSHHHNTRRHHDGTLPSPPPKRSRPDSPGSTPAPVTTALENVNHPSQDHGGRDSLLGQALEGSTPINSHHYQGGATSGEDSSSEDESEQNGDGGEGNISAMDTPNLPPPPKREPLEYHDDLPPHHRGVSPSLSSVDLMNASGLDLPRTPTFPGALLQGLPGLLPGPSGLHNSTPDVNYGVEPRSVPNDATDSQDHAPDPRPLPQSHQPPHTSSTPSTSSPSSPGILSLQESGGPLNPRFSDPSRPTCPFCGRTYSSPSNLRQHVSNVHVRTDEDSWEVCDVCGRRCKTRHYLVNHRLQAHGIRVRPRWPQMFQPM